MRMLTIKLFDINKFQLFTERDYKIYIGLIKLKRVKLLWFTINQLLVINKPKFGNVQLKLLNNQLLPITIFFLFMLPITIK